MATVDNRGESEIYSDILRGRRQYFVDKVKAPIYKALTILSKRYLEPTKENTKKRMSHILLDVFDEFFKFEDNQGRIPLFRAVRRIIISEVEHDNYYSQRLTWFLKKLVEKYIGGEWPPLEPWAPMDNWKDPATLEALELARQEFREKLTVGGRSIGDIET